MVLLMVSCRGDCCLHDEILAACVHRHAILSTNSVISTYTRDRLGKIVELLDGDIVFAVVELLLATVVAVVIVVV
jgi:hypothetical protein